ncbi:MAG TPA: DUF3465 domain-containing protein [Cellvibrionaceae bacterium]|nr:DUF3465 domain-containing protein [Cellvibrionaceae bacterium]HMW46738.1 DUF3465 domain-containing protein [Cellvibrionaceae bacterium]HMW73732.1 DUF3465 domain-containing protein [Cellvibrionaceae bacterium]HMY40632.1 DUF3465 domain-containing protein [Marinagarivorans sp.]HNG58320.1 DUF3465 domain-containing protein [Cellvibrionaceae bacterium]
MKPILAIILSFFILTPATYCVAATTRQIVPPPIEHTAAGNGAIDQAFEQGRSDLQVTGRGTVFKVLADDNDGSRHQKFLVRLPSGLTVLIAHNIDLAPRINNLKVSDSIEFYGEYEWNEKGGVVHWTHRDPKGRHPAGWLKHKGQKYQ